MGSLKRKCHHFDESFITGCTESCHFDNFRCSQWWRFHQNDDIFVSVLVLLVLLRCNSSELAMDYIFLALIHWDYLLKQRSYWLVHHYCMCTMLTLDSFHWHQWWQGIYHNHIAISIFSHEYLSSVKKCTHVVELHYLNSLAPVISDVKIWITT